MGKSVCSNVDSHFREFQETGKDKDYGYSTGSLFLKEKEHKISTIPNSGNFDPGPKMLSSSIGGLPGEKWIAGSNSPQKSQIIKDFKNALKEQVFERISGMHCHLNDGYAWPSLFEKLEGIGFEIDICIFSERE